MHLNWLVTAWNPLVSFVLDLLSTYYYVTSHIDKLENISLLNYAGLPVFVTIPYKIFLKSHLMILLPISSENAFK